MLFVQYIREIPLFILKNFTAYGSRVHFSPNSLLKTFFFGLAAPPPRDLLIDEFPDLRKATIGFVMSLRPFVYIFVSSWTNSAPTEKIFMKFYI
jgi:hypothetical protein